MTTLNELIEQHGDGDHFHTTDIILRDLKVSKTAAEILRPALIEYVQRHYRQRTRTVEMQAELVGGSSTAHGRSLFTAERFSIGDGKFVTWGQATVEQHEMRISALIAYRHGLDRTIERHREAIRTIQAAGVFCLDQIEGAA